MALNSFNFWIVFPFIFLLYWVIPAKHVRARNVYLLGVSYLLYMCWKPAFAVILAGVTLITYVGALICSRQDAGRKTLFALFLVLALFPLLIFKYYDFINDSLTTLLGYCGLQFSLPGLNWAIPVGISFFTFQAVGYLLDVYHQRTEVEKDLLTYALFVSFFPQVASGPISTANELLPQFKTPHHFRFDQGCDGLRMVLWGMFLKCVLADRLALYANIVFDAYNYYSGLNCLIASLCYSLQIYGDFAGYSLMAVGIAKTLGFSLINNFNRPYFSTSITDFWKRWHISLTRWLTQHVYINLGGNRRGKVRQYFNIMITFLVSGIWHGANWTFVVWGALHGLFQIIEKAMGIDPKGKNSNTLNSYTWMKPIRILVTFTLVNFAWIFFRMPSITDAWNMIVHIFTDRHQQAIMLGATNSDILYMVIAIICLLCVDIKAEFLPTKMKWLDSSAAKWVLSILAFCMVLGIGVLNSGSFIYVSF